MKYMKIYNMFKGYSNKGLIKLREQLATRYLKLFDSDNYVIDVHSERVLYRFEICLLTELRARGILPPEPGEEFIRKPGPIKEHKRRKYEDPAKTRQYNRTYYNKNKEAINESQRLYRQSKRED